MSISLEQLKETISTLPRTERAELAHFLLLSLEPEEDGAEAAWRAELERRDAEFRSGQVEGRPIQNVLARLRERYP
jgi:putative addiction module component (TIGR02574 family)